MISSCMHWLWKQLRLAFSCTTVSARDAETERFATGLVMGSVSVMATTRPRARKACGNDSSTKDTHGDDLEME